MPAIASSFVLTQIFGWAYMLGTIALSLMFLAGYGGMVSLAQMTIAGFAGYIVAILGVNGVPGGMGWPWWLAVPAALVALDDCRRDRWRARGAHRGHLHDHDHARDRRGVLLFHQRELRDLQRPHRHRRRSDAPRFLGVDWHAPIPFYYLTLAVAVLCWLAVSYVARTPFGLALQGIRDNPGGWRRSASTSMPIASPPMCSPRSSPALGGVLLVWSYGEIAPGTVSVSAAIDILVIAVVGGIGNPIGAFIGALIYAVLKTFALDFLVAVRAGRQPLSSADRFRLPGDRLFLAGRRDRTLGALAPSRAARFAAREPPGGGHG
jgi:branched-chain amino acid transport system permease protein